MNRVHHWICGSNLWARLLREKLMPWALDGVDLGGNILEVGPGPGLTTEVLRHRAARVTSIEIDPVLARSLGCKLSGTNVRVIEGDAFKNIRVRSFAANLLTLILSPKCRFHRK